MQIKFVIAESDQVQRRALRRPPQDTADSEWAAAAAAPRQPLDLLTFEVPASSSLVPERILEATAPRLQ